MVNLYSKTLVFALSLVFVANCRQSEVIEEDTTTSSSGGSNSRTQDVRLEEGESAVAPFRVVNVQNDPSTFKLKFYAPSSSKLKKLSISEGKQVAAAKLVMKIKKKNRTYILQKAKDDGTLEALDSSFQVVSKGIHQHNFGDQALAYLRGLSGDVEEFELYLTDKSSPQAKISDAVTSDKFVIIYSQQDIPAPPPVNPPVTQDDDLKECQNSAVTTTIADALTYMKSAGGSTERGALLNKLDSDIPLLRRQNFVSVLSLANESNSRYYGGYGARIHGFNEEIVVDLTSAQGVITPITFKVSPLLNQSIPEQAKPVVDPENPNKCWMIYKANQFPERGWQDQTYFHHFCMVYTVDETGALTDLEARRRTYEDNRPCFQTGNAVLNPPMDDDGVCNAGAVGDCLQAPSH